MRIASGKLYSEAHNFDEPPKTEGVEQPDSFYQGQQSVHTLHSLI